MHKMFTYYLENGGIINFSIFTVAVATLYIGIGKLIRFRLLAKKAVCMELGNKKFLKFIANIFLEYKYKDAYSVKNVLKEEMMKILPEIMSGIDTMAVLIQTAPLLGLFGTVVGMIKTFCLITKYGTSDPVILTKGITVSLLTTQSGLLVAFSSLLFHDYVCNKKDRLIKKIMIQAQEITIYMEKKDE